MKTLLVTLVLFLVPVFADAGTVRTKGYTKKNGTYVAPHYKSTRNKSKFDNYNTKGNVNIYTGKKGTKDPLK